MTLRLPLFSSLMGFFAFLAMATPFSSTAQLPVVHANSEETWFQVADFRSGWWLDPSLKPDVFETDKTSQPITISYHTGTDSLEVTLGPGDSLDFVVVWAGDSCFQRIVCPAPITRFRDLRPIAHDTIPFELTDQNNLKVEVVLNDSDTLHLHFDTGGTGVVLTQDAIRNRTSLLDQKDSTSNPLAHSHTFSAGPIHWDEVWVYPTRVQPTGLDGSFGWDLFDGRLVEIDYDRQVLIVHSSMPKKPEGYHRVPIQYTHTLFCVQAEMEVRGKRYSNRYLFDTGFQRSVLLDSVLVEEQGFPKDLPRLNTLSLRNTRGQEFITRVVDVDEITLADWSLEHIPTRMLSAPNPARFKTHLFGNEFLKRFNLILDFQENYVYLKPNENRSAPYADVAP